MNEDTRWKLVAGTGLVTLSLALYTLHYWIFHDAEHILMFGFGDIAFIPLEVLIVTLIIEQMLEARERRQRMEKLNMVIGNFFSTMGVPLMTLLVRADPSIDTLRKHLVVRDNWRKNDFIAMKPVMKEYHWSTDIDRIDLVAARRFLLDNEEFLLRLVENPMVFEHESFTDLILAINHLNEELKSRGDLLGLPRDDRAHLATDFQRIYTRIVSEWLEYMEYLKNQYPYLFNLAMRKNPFDESASVVIGKER